MKQFDAIIIGFGKGGKTLAAEFAKRGKKVAIIERSSQMYGGTCINIGCIPTKTLVHLSKVASNLKDHPFEARKKFYRNAIEEKEKVTTLLRDKNYHNLADNPNITVYTGVGSFLTDNTIHIKITGEETIIKSDNIIINTGARTVIPPISGIKDNPYVYTSTSIMEMRELPEKLTIIGGGYIGLEFASMYASFGSNVTVLESYPQLIGREDRDIAEAVKEALEKKGVKFRMNVSVNSVGLLNEMAYTEITDKITGKTEKLISDAVLLATGRVPETAELNLQNAGVKTEERGAILVNEHLVTSNPKIRAVGDVKGGLQFTYISLDDYRIIKEDLFGKGERTLNNRGPVSYSVFIDPPLSRVGISEDEAEKQNLDVIVKKLPVMAIPRAKTLGETVGLQKAIIEKSTGKILGCTLFSPDSSETINIVAAAMKAGLPYTFLRDFIFTHPSMSESLNDLFTL